MKILKSIRLIIALATAAPFSAGIAIAAEDTGRAPGVILAQAETPKLFRGIGKITAIDAPSGVVTIKHEAISGLMDAMEMQFEAKPANILDGLKIGDAVEFTLDGKNWTLLAIGKAHAAN